ncbi:hypothetical protein O0I10_006410 [Lichtheimia ornata]|uniref:DNA polymerase delta subunit 3 n=1 Tax=Lichtheimia ornata TaxID=688661 RepID=A0AAD7V2I5_9FUNG|nr:uncharacterized protein O0I10_006410 [Lichtheimia ornata]KAJ8657882.1 hypothetical protein O0I10_006410 [Lichtheimia ornata]
MDEYLTVTVLQEKRPVTYKLLARQLGLHVNKAKQALWTFAQANEQVRSVYYIGGELIGEDRYTMRLVKDNELEETKKLFKTITGMHVYSVLPYEPKDLSVLVTASRDIPHLALADRIKCGVFKCSTADDTYQPSKTSTTASTTTTSTFAKQPEPATTKPASSEKKPEPAPKKSTTASIFGEKNTTSTTLGKRQEREEEKSTSKNKNVPSTSSAPKKQSPPPPSVSADDIFFDDGDEDMKDAGTPVRDDPMQTDDKANTPDKAPVQEEEAAPSSPATTSTTPGKTKRKVLKKKQYTNERGFMVTEDVWEWEEVDAPEAAATTTTTMNSPKRTPEEPKKKSFGGKKKSGGAQQDLFSFWKKR